MSEDGTGSEVTEQLPVDLWGQFQSVNSGRVDATRRGVLASLAGAVSMLGFGGTAAGATPSFEQDPRDPAGQEGPAWPPGWDPRRDGIPGAGPTNEGCPPETLSETWKSGALEDGVNLMRLRPDGADEKPVYAYGMGLLSPTGYIHALDPETGEELSGEWPVETSGIPLITSVEGELLFVAEAQQAGPGTNLRALNPETGAEQWSRDLPGAGIIPLVTYDRDRELLLSITDGPTVMGIDTDDGSEVWSAQLGDNGSSLFPIPVGGTLYLMTNDVGSTGVQSATLWAIDTGENVADRELWSETRDNRAMASLTVARDGTLVAGFVEPVQVPEESDVIAFDPDDGSVRWSRSTGQEPQNEFYSGLAVAIDGGVYVPKQRNPGSDSPDYLLEKFDLGSGETEWEYATGAITTGTEFDDSNVYLSTLGGDVIALDDDPDNGGYGDQVWSRSLDGEIADIGLRLGCGTLYTGPDAQGTVHALDAADGSTLDTFSVDSGVLTQVRPSRGSLWVATGAEENAAGTLATENRVYRLDAGSDQPDGPEASFTVDPASPAPGEDVTFDAAESSGDIVEYRWDVDGDGENDATTTDPTHVSSYQNAGSYDATLTVEDGDGNTDSATETVVVSEGDGPAPIVGSDPPQDLDGDGNFEDVDGSGDFNITDVQILFQNLNSDAVQDNAEAFNFSGNNPDTVTITDVQVLFQQL